MTIIHAHLPSHHHGEFYTNFKTIPSPYHSKVYNIHDYDKTTKGNLEHDKGHEYTHDNVSCPCRYRFFYGVLKIHNHDSLQVKPNIRTWMGVSS